MTTRPSPGKKSPTHTNRLASEKSPYLLQHAHNPVDWFPWGEEAFLKARGENKPIFLSVGYSTCHWCHVMERESFENAGTARLLNDHFVSIKVDREERPDIDNLYMTFVQVTTREGGWPMSVFLTPDRLPFFGGTYFPPEPRFGKPSFPDLLREIHQTWVARHDEIVTSATDLAGRLSELAAIQDSDPAGLSVDILNLAMARIKASYDPLNGGFGQAPKFPHPCIPAFLLAHARRRNDSKATEMVLNTCRHMAAGGIHDQLGGGFARYSTDAQWLVPHFEKMLYDNAQLAGLYLDAFQVSGDDAFADVARGILRYVQRDMTHPDGGFYSAEDADSEGREGRFYCWTADEMRACLSPGEFAVASRHFGITDGGNFTDHSDPDPLPGLNILHVAAPALSPADRILADSARAHMLAARARRVRPHRDDKILVSWNGLMLSAFARAHAILGDIPFLEVAENNLQFIKQHLWDSSSCTLHHRWCDGSRDSVQLLSAYAFLLVGVLDLYQATLDPSHLEFALQLADGIVRRFYDSSSPGFWQAEATDDLFMRTRDNHDGAEPAGASMAILGLLRLSAITGREDFQSIAQGVLQSYSARLRQYPEALAAMLQAARLVIEPVSRVVIAGDPAEPATRAMVHAAHIQYDPSRVVMGNRGPVDSFARSLTPVGGHPAAYRCSGTTCQPPVTDPGQLTPDRNAAKSNSAKEN